MKGYLTQECVSTLAAKALYILNENVEAGKFSGLLVVDDALGLGERRDEIGDNAIKIFAVSVQVGAREMELEFQDFSHEIIEPAVFHLADILNALPGKYVSPVTTNFSDDCKLSNCAGLNGISVEVEYGYDMDTHTSVLTLYVMAIQKSAPKIFLGGTCARSQWREELISMLDTGVVGHYNPVVEDWTPECMDEEIKQRGECDFCLYVITPRMQGVYSIAEVVFDACNRPDKCIFCVIDSDGDMEFDNHQLKSLNQVKRMVEGCGSKVCENLQDIADYVNN